MPKRILVMGLPGAGKTYLAQHIVDHLQAEKKTVMLAEFVAAHIIDESITDISATKIRKQLGVK